MNRTEKRSFYRSRDIFYYLLTFANGTFNDIQSALDDVLTVCSIRTRQEHIFVRYITFHTNGTSSLAFFEVLELIREPRTKTKWSGLIKVLMIWWCCHQHYYRPRSYAYIYVGDGCWRRNVLATTLRFWCRFWPFSSPTSSIF